jgi:putative peptide zinc metalloprotease protein
MPDAALSAPTRLLPLREEIAIFPAPAALDGAPSWTLHDPVRNRFYRLGWQEFEILSRWDAGTIERVSERVGAETTLQVTAEDVDQLGRFLFACDLLRATTPGATDLMLQRAARQRESWGQWLLHNYLFTRIPLVRPDRFLTATYPSIRWVYSRGFALAIAAIGLLGLYLVARQWDSFLATFVDLFSVSGAVWFAVTLFGLKLVHELGHAYTAKRFGCRVPTMGVAILVMVPVAYTDVNEAWKVTARRQRLAIGLAGVTTELCCAAIAACAWGFLPEGPARSVAFLVATSTWLTTVLINLSPFMRYDGYYVLSDWLETPNLHIRAFALAQWWMREKLLGLGDLPPEELPAPRRRFLTLFAYLTWVYRFSLFMGIAAIIYHFAVKFVGIGMMVVEIGYFLVRPVYNEGRTWWKRRADIRWCRRTIASSLGVVLIVVLLLVPWRSTIEAPALLRSRQHVDVFVPDFGARVVTIAARDGEKVAKGAPLLQLASPDLDYQILREQTDLDVLRWEFASRGLNSDLLANSQVTAQQYAQSLAEHRGLVEQKNRLAVKAPIAGDVVDVAENLDPGSWLPAKSRLLSIIDPTAATVEAYVAEADLGRIAVGDRATFFAVADSRIELPLHIAEIARASTTELPDTYLASTFGGPIAVRPSKAGSEAQKSESDKTPLVPDETLYRVTLAPENGAAAPAQVTRGVVTLHGEATSIIIRVWRSFLAVVIREGGA